MQENDQKLCNECLDPVTPHQIDSGEATDYFGLGWAHRRCFLDRDRAEDIKIDARAETRGESYRHV